MRQRSSAVLVTAAVLLLLQLVSAGVPTGPVVEPAFQSIREGGNATVACRFNAPLSDCYVWLWERSLSVDTILDFRRGGASPTVTVTGVFGETWMTAKYAGAGLAQGYCGVELAGVSSSWYLVQCRGESRKTGEWSQAFGVVESQDRMSVDLMSSTPLHIVALPGTDVSVLFSAIETLESCSIETPAAGRLNLDPGRQPPAGSRYRLHGVGPGNGECGYTLTNVTAADAGLWDLWGRKANKEAYEMVVVAVAAPPVEDPTLRLDDASQLRAGDTLRATCQTSPSVPPAQITWLLGDRVVRADAWNSTLDADAAKTTLPWESQPTRQTLSVVLTPFDLGKRLECRVSHVALSDPWTSSVKLGNAMAGFYIQNIGTGLVLSVQGNQPRSPAVMQRYNADDQRQLWTYSDNMLYSLKNGLVLDVNQDGFLMSYRAHGGPNQRWHFEDKTIRNGNGKVMDVHNGSVDVGAKVQTYLSNNTPAQQFATVSPGVK